MKTMQKDEVRRNSINLNSAMHMLTRAAAAAIALFSIQTVQAQNVVVPQPRPDVLEARPGMSNLPPALPAGTAAARIIPGLTDERPPVGQTQMLTCTANRPHQIQRFAVTCRAPVLDVAIADCCIPGDHWEASVQTRDEKPVTAMTTSPGPANLFGSRARVYRFAGTPFNPNLDAIVECRYLHGIHVFPAATFIRLDSAGPCTVVDLGHSEEIQRTP